MFQYKIHVVSVFPNAFGDPSKFYIIMKVSNDETAERYRVVFKNQSQQQVAILLKTEHFECGALLKPKFLNHISDIGIYRTN